MIKWNVLMIKLKVQMIKLKVQMIKQKAQMIKWKVQMIKWNAQMIKLKVQMIKLLIQSFKQKVKRCRKIMKTTAIKTSLTSSWTMTVFMAETALLATPGFLLTVIFVLLGSGLWFIIQLNFLNVDFVDFSK